MSENERFIDYLLNNSPFKIRNNGEGKYELVSRDSAVRNFNYQWFFVLDTSIESFQEQLREALISWQFDGWSREWLKLFLERTEILLKNGFFKKEDMCL